MKKAFFLYLFSGLTYTAAEQEQVKVMVEWGWPPYYTNSIGEEPAGFAVDLALAICEVVELDCALSMHDWTLADIPSQGYKDGLFDISMVWKPTTERLDAGLIFTIPYEENEHSIFFGEPLATTTSIGVIKSFAASKEALVSYGFPAGLITEYEYGDEASLYSDLQTGVIATVFLDPSLIEPLIAQGMTQVDSKAVGDGRSMMLYAGAGAPDAAKAENLRFAFTKGLKMLMWDGTYNKLAANYPEINVIDVCGVINGGACANRRKLLFGKSPDCPQWCI